MYAFHLKLKPTPPFNFELSTRIFSEGDAEIRIYNDGNYQQLIRTI